MRMSMRIGTQRLEKVKSATDRNERNKPNCIDEQAES